MRDIRADLEERLSKAEAERERLVGKLADVDERVAYLKRLLEEEERVWQDLEPPLIGRGQYHGPAANGELTDLGKYLLGLLRDGQPHPRGYLQDLVEKKGLLDPGSAPGRAVHGALVGLQRRGYIRRRRDAQWQLANRNSDAPRNDTRGAS